jgi:hypothetical protein
VVRYEGEVELFVERGWVRACASVHVVDVHDDPDLDFGTWWGTITSEEVPNPPVGTRVTIRFRPGLAARALVVTTAFDVMGMQLAAGLC